MAGCYRQFGLAEATRRTIRELIRSLKQSDSGLDFSLVTEQLAIGAAPRSLHSVNRLKDLGFRYVIDLRAERGPSDVLGNTRDLLVKWVPMYDDWKPVAPELFRELDMEIKKVLLSEQGGKLFICCGAGEHRAPLAGILALVIMGHSLEHAMALIVKARPKSELLPVYRSSLTQSLG